MKRIDLTRLPCASLALREPGGVEWLRFVAAILALLIASPVSSLAGEAVR